MNRKLLTECIGTFFLVFTVGLTASAGLPQAPLAIGIALMAMVYMGGHVSGAHYNPVVTLAVLIRGKIAAGEAAAYMAAQLAGAVLAAAAVYGAAGSTFAPAPSPAATPVQVLLVEGLFTFALALVVLNVATARTTAGNAYFGLAIGFTVAAAAFAGGDISGGAFNPAVGVGPALFSAVMGDGGLASVWYYLAGPFAGAALAAVAFRVQNPEEHAAPAAAPVTVSFTAIATPAEAGHER